MVRGEGEESQVNEGRGVRRYDGHPHYRPSSASSSSRQHLQRHLHRPNGAATCTPGTRPAHGGEHLARDRTPSASAASLPTVAGRRIRSSTSSGTVTPGTSLARNSALRSETSGQMPGDDRDAEAPRCACRKRSSCREIEHRLGDRELGARLDLPREAAQLALEIRRAGIDADADARSASARRSGCRRDRGRG